MTKMISWNVNGLRACIKRFLDYFNEVDADIFVFKKVNFMREF